MLVYVDTSEVREGALEELKSAVEELVDFLDANVPRVIAYNVYFSDDGGQMTVVHIHPDSTSLESHMDVGGPAFRRFADLLTLSSIRVYGEPSEKGAEPVARQGAIAGMYGRVRARPARRIQPLPINLFGVATW